MALSSATRLQVHGHRGCRGLFPENTLPAFLHALALGVDVLELDVVISQDKQVVVAHDPWLSAQLGPGPLGQLIDPRYEQDYKLYRLPYATIRQCEVGIWPQPLFPEQQTVRTYRPLLAEVLAATQAACQRLHRPPAGYSVEIKSSPAGDNIYHPSPATFAALVLAELYRAGVNTLTTILSFDYRVLQAVRQQAPEVAVCLLVEGAPITDAVFSCLEFVPDVFGPDYHLLSPYLVQELTNKYPRLQLVPWTVNSLPELASVAEWGIAGITTDYPDRLLKLLNRNRAM